MPHNTDTDGNGNGDRKRWYDSTKMIWALFSVVGALIGFICAILWAQISASANEVSVEKAMNNAQEVKIQKIDTTLNNLDMRQTRIEAGQDKLNDKMDKIIDRLPPR